MTGFMWAWMWGLAIATNTGRRIGFCTIRIYLTFQYLSLRKFHLPPHTTFHAATYGRGSLGGEPLRTGRSTSVQPFSVTVNLCCVKAATTFTDLFQTQTPTARLWSAAASASVTISSPTAESDNHISRAAPYTVTLLASCNGLQTRLATIRCNLHLLLWTSVGTKHLPEQALGFASEQCSHMHRSNGGGNSAATYGPHITKPFIRWVEV